MLPFFVHRYLYLASYFAFLVFAKSSLLFFVKFLFMYKLFIPGIPKFVTALNFLLLA